MPGRTGVNPEPGEPRERRFAVFHNARVTMKGGKTGFTLVLAQLEGAHELLEAASARSMRAGFGVWFFFIYGFCRRLTVRRAQTPDRRGLERAFCVNHKRALRSPRASEFARGEAAAFGCIYRTKAGSGAAAPVSVAFGHALYEQVRAAARRVSGCKPRAVTRHRRARR